MNQKIPDNEIIKMFQRYLASGDPSEVNKLNAEDLTVAEARLAIRWTNPQFIEAIKNKRKELELKESRKYESKIRAWNLVTGLILGLTIASVAAWLFTT